MAELNNVSEQQETVKTGFSKKKKIIITLLVLLAALIGFWVWFSGLVGGISKAEAKEIALKQVPGAKEEEMIISDGELEDMQKSYEVQISHDNRLYEFQILARNGKITEQEMQTMLPAQAPKNQQNDKVVDNIGLDKAKQIAADSVSGASIDDVKSAQLEDIDGHYCYEVEIKHDKKIYEITIDPVTGDVLGNASEPARD